MRLRFFIIAATAFDLAGCSGPPDGRAVVEASPLIFKPAAAVPAESVAAIAPAPSGYKLSAVEEKLDCAKLTGHMKVKIANMRSTVTKPTGTAIGQTIQSAASPVFGGTRRGIDVTADLALDRAKLEAFNKRLAEKKCKTVDIDAELKGETPARPTPKNAG